VLEEDQANLGPSRCPDQATRDSSAPSIGINLDPEWVPARLTPVRRATSPARRAISIVAEPGQTSNRSGGAKLLEREALQGRSAGSTSGHCPIWPEPDEVDTEVGMGGASPLALTRRTSFRDSSPYCFAEHENGFRRMLPFRHGALRSRESAFGEWLGRGAARRGRIRGWYHRTALAHQAGHSRAAPRG
jgi:hypothetical protein